MAVIIISSDSLPKAAQIAAETAKALNYRCLGREILREVGEKVWRIRGKASQDAG